MTILQRSSEASAELLWCAPGGPFPINAQVVVGANECVVASLDGAIVGVIPPGSHWLHPQPFPFLAHAVAGGTHVRVELWFVTTSTFAGVKFGGQVGEMLDAGSSVEVAPRVMGEYSLQVENPTALVTACMGQNQTSASGLVSWVSGIVLKQVKETVGRLVMAEGVAIMGPQISQRVTAELPAAMSEMSSLGLAFRELRSFTLAFSDEDREALTAAYAAKAAEKRAAAMPNAPAPSRACSRCQAVHTGGRFCTTCGQPLPAA